MRGNVDTRLRKVRDGELDAVVLAYAGLRRLGRAGEVDRGARPDPGAARAGPGRARGRVPRRRRRRSRVLASLDHADTRAAVAAERALLAALEAGCSAPVGALADVAEGDDGPRELSSADRSPRSTAAMPSGSRPPVRTDDADGVGRRLGRRAARRRRSHDDGEHHMTRARKPAGHVTFVGAGPGRPRPADDQCDRRRSRTPPLVVADADGAGTDPGADAGHGRESPSPTPAETVQGGRWPTPAAARTSCGWSSATRSPTTTWCARCSRSPRRWCRSTSCPRVPRSVGTTAYAGVPTGGLRLEADLRDAATADYDALAHATRHPGAHRRGTRRRDGRRAAGRQRLQAGHAGGGQLQRHHHRGSRPSLGQLGELELAAAGMTGPLVDHRRQGRRRSATS